MSRLQTVLLSFLFSTSILAQEPQVLENLPVPDFIDTLFIDRDINNWSLRTFVNYKNHRFQLGNDDYKQGYTPSNPGGVGFGLATKKLIIDCGFNLQLRDKERTERVDFRIALLMQKHNFSYFLQSYKGFNLNPDFDLDNNFRHDINSLSSGLNYMYLFNASEFSLTAMKSGLSTQKRTALSFGLGGFLFYNRLLADSTIVPLELQIYSNNQAMLTRLYGAGGGVQGGFSIIIPFLKKLIASASITPGIGVIYKNVHTETSSYVPSNPFIAETLLEGLIGYNGKNIYLNCTLTYAYYKTSLDFGNWIGYQTTQAKIVFGYKLGSK